MKDSPLFKKNLFRLLSYTFLIIIVCACRFDGKLPAPGTIYEISSPDMVGVVLLAGDEAQQQSRSVLYADRGELFARPESVMVRLGRRNAWIDLGDGTERRLKGKPYRVPEFTELPCIRPYLDSVFRVREERDVLYGEADGYWTSCPNSHWLSIPDLIISHMGELLKKRNCLLTMDIYLPDEPARGSRPLFLIIHGGAFYLGDKAEPEYEGWCRYFASLGYVAAAINYRMGYIPGRSEVSRAGYRAVQDAHAAIRFLISQERFRIDPDRIFVAGTSAGAITALNLAFLREENRPRCTKGGLVGGFINRISGASIGDEGALNAINPDDTINFSVRAVANMWGAIQDLDIMKNAEVSIISFHSEDDPIIPYGYGYPLSNSLVFKQMYGSRYIDQKARSLGYPSSIHTYKEPRHSLQLNEDGDLSPLFYEIEYEIAHFFSEQMEDNPIRLHIDREDERWIRIDPTSVKRVYWQVEGGVVREKEPDGIRVLLFADAPIHKITVAGEYGLGTTFRKEIEL